MTIIYSYHHPRILSQVIMDSLKQTQSFAEETFEEDDIINDNVEFLEKEDKEISGNKTPPHHQSSSSASAAPPSAPKKAKKTQNPKGKQPAKKQKLQFEEDEGDNDDTNSSSLSE